MAWTKPTFYLSLVFLGIIFFVNLADVGTDFVNNDRIELDEKSLDYVSALKGQNENSGVNTIRDTDASTSQNINPLEDEEGGQVSTDNDFLSTFLIKKERASQPLDYMKIAYNIPTSILIGFGLPIDPFNHSINIITYTLVIAFIILLVRYLVT